MNNRSTKHKILFLCLVFFVANLAYGQNKIIVSDNPIFNAIVHGFYGYPESPTGEYVYAQIEKANLDNGVFRNVIRLWYGKNDSDYINLFYQIFPSETAAKASLYEEVRADGKVLYLDWDEIKGSYQTIDLTTTTFKSVKDKNFHKTACKRKNKNAEIKHDRTKKEILKEEYISLSFEDLQIKSSNFLGLDAETGLNANYYSRDKRIITLQGTEKKAWAELSKAPNRKGNALHFIAVTPNDKDIYGEKIRVSASIQGLKAVEIISSVDIYIPSSWNLLTINVEPINWLTVQEYWCAVAGVPVEGEPQFRMTLGMLKKEGGGQDLYFDLKAEDLETAQLADGSWKETYTTLYELDDRISNIFKIPIGQWFNLKTEIVSGDKETGHFRLIATDSNGQETVIFNETCQTYATGYLKPKTKKPLYKAVSPLKLYTSSNTLQKMKGLPLEIFFDNWTFKAHCLEDE